MVLEPPWAQKRIFSAFEKSIFQSFPSFWVKKLKPFSSKVRQSVQTYLNQNLLIGSFLENGIGATLSSKTNVLGIWKGHFSVFANFWVTKLKPFSGKVRQSMQNYLNQNLVIGSFLENGFEASFSAKKNVVSVWKEHFSNFGKSLSDKFETIFSKSKAKCLKLFKEKFRHKKLLKKWLWSSLELKKESSMRVWKKHFSFFWQIFEWRSWNHFLGKWGKVLKSI